MIYKRGGFEIKILKKQKIDESGCLVEMGVKNKKLKNLQNSNPIGIKGLQRNLWIKTGLSCSAAYLKIKEETARHSVKSEPVVIIIRAACLWAHSRLKRLDISIFLIVFLLDRENYYEQQTDLKPHRNFF